MYKKFASMVLVLICATSLVACGGGTGSAAMKIAAANAATSLVGASCTDVGPVGQVSLDGRTYRGDICVNAAAFWGSGITSVVLRGDNGDNPVVVEAINGVTYVRETYADSSIVGSSSQLIFSISQYIGAGGGIIRQLSDDQCQDWYGIGGVRVGCTFSGVPENVPLTYLDVPFEGPTSSDGIGQRPAVPADAIGQVASLFRIVMITYSGSVTIPAGTMLQFQLIGIDPSQVRRFIVVDSRSGQQFTAGYSVSADGTVSLAVSEISTGFVRDLHVLVEFVPGAISAGLATVVVPPAIFSTAPVSSDGTPVRAEGVVSGTGATVPLQNEAISITPVVLN